MEFPFVSEHHIGTIAGLRELPAPLPLLLSLHHRAGGLGFIGVVPLCCLSRTPDTILTVLQR